ncbi:MAG: ATP-binding cassette domain-containing protein [Lachnospiraceae bacterium]|nr:ATP-binding cassette domain-containing protein [Lachnospiraceae bacterium]
MTYLLETRGLGKEIRKQRIVTDLSMHVKKGEIYGFLGPNGAGKTTVLKLVTGLLKPTEGEIVLFGKRTGRNGGTEKVDRREYGNRADRDLSYALKRMGILLEFPVFYDWLTGRENLELHREYMGYYRHGSIEEVLRLLRLEEVADRPVKDYSLGTKERLGIARAMLCRPELLILDEPLNGLDPEGIRQVRELLKGLSLEYGVTVLISSHILSEVESIADTVGILSKGRLKEEISMKELLEKSVSFVEVLAADRKKAAFLFAEALNLSEFQMMEDGKFRIYKEGISVERLAKILTEGGAGVLSIGRKTETLEDYFLKLVGEGLQ